MADLHFSRTSVSDKGQVEAFMIVQGRIGRFGENARWLAHRPTFNVMIFRQDVILWARAEKYIFFNADFAPTKVPY